MKLHDDWAFVTKPSFYAMVGGAIALWLMTDGYITEGLGQCLTVIFGGFVVVNRIDRNVDRISDN